jgi:hypothetical protein
MTTYTLLGLGACTLGCLCIYLAAPNQRWLPSAWPARPARLAGALLVLLAWWALAQDMQRLTASFLLITTAMWMLALLPYLGAWRVLRRGGQA